MSNNNDYAEAHQRFEANLQTAKAEMQQSGLDPDTGFAPGQVHHSQAPEPVVNAYMLAEADRLQAARDESGRRPYVEDEAYRNKVEQMRRQAFGADPVQPQQATPQAPTGPKPAEGTPGERMTEYLEQGGTVGQSDVNEGTWEALTAGYDVDLPEGFVLAGEHVEMLWNARKTGVSQDVVTRYIAEALKE